MLRKRLHSKRHLKMLEYVVEDFLEVKTSLDSKKREPLKEFLFSRDLDDCLPSPLEGFRLAHKLVLLEPTDPEGVDHLIFVHPRDGKIRVRKLLKMVYF